LVGHVLGIVVGFGGWDTAEAVHEAVVVVSGDVVGGDEFDIAEGAQRAAAHGESARRFPQGRRGIS